jgi:hypothetical protein
MSENLAQDLEDLLAREGMDDVDALMDWARERASNLASAVGEDQELGPLLESGGQAGDAPPVAEVPAAEGTEARDAAPAVEQTPIAARREPSNAAPLPPIPVSTPATPTDELEIDEIEELDMEELELLDDVEEDEDGEDGEDEQDTNVGPPPSPPAPAQSEEAPSPPEDAPSYGPPDGNEVVPEWKAALMSTQTDSDEEAAARIKEASSAEPLPTAPEPDSAAMPLSGRLEAEEDEISRHSIDLSDLDTDDE